MEYNCSCCSYTTIVKANYGKHLESNKHMKNFSKALIIQKQQNETPKLPDNPKTTEVIEKGSVCKNCDKVFAFKQSMYRHMKHSCKEKDLKDLIASLNLKLDNQAKEFNKKINYLTMKLEKLSGEKSADF
jgi:hypothetical protein